ncbi:MAG: HEPN domain-containing protein [Candidatus Hydrogenedentales bacterium]|jgi:HEPN domain-containing protein
MKPPDEVKLEFLRQWVAKAEEDLGAARALFDSEEGYYAAIGFHCQQAVEKYLKALLTWRQVEFPKTHDLLQLLSLLSLTDPELVHSLSNIEELTPFGVAMRYPGDAPEPSRNESQSALHIADATRTAIIQTLPDSL